MLDNNTLIIKQMNKLKEFLSLMKDNLNGKFTHIFIVVILTLLIYKILGIIGLIVAFIISIGIDACDTFNLKDIYTFFKNKFFPIIAIALLIVSCGTSKTVSDIYSMSHMVLISKDTISSTVYHQMVKNNEIPPIDKFSKSYLKNDEEKIVNAYYLYFDSISGKLFNIKEIIMKKDTSYILEKKIIKN